MGVGVDHPVDRGVRQPAAVALGPDDGRRVEVNCVTAFPCSPRARSSGPKASGSSAPGRGPRGWSINSPGRRVRAAPACTARTASAGSPRRPRTTVRRAGRRRRNAGRRPQRTRHRDLGHMRHSPHCSRPRSGRRRPAPPPRPGTANTARMRATDSDCLVPQRLPVDFSVMSAPPPSECIPKPSVPWLELDVGNPNFARFRAPTSDASSFTTFGIRVARSSGRLTQNRRSPTSTDGVGGPR